MTATLVLNLQTTCRVHYNLLPRNCNLVARLLLRSYRLQLPMQTILPLLQLWAKAAAQQVGLSPRTFRTRSRHLPRFRLPLATMLRKIWLLGKLSGVSSITTATWLRQLGCFNQAVSDFHGTLVRSVQSGLLAMTKQLAEIQMLAV